MKTNHETRELLQEMARLSYVDYVTVEPLRGEPPKEGMGPPSVEQMKKIHELQHKLNVELLGRKHPVEAPLMLSHIRTLHREQHKVLETETSRYRLPGRRCAGCARSGWSGSTL